MRKMPILSCCVGVSVALVFPQDSVCTGGPGEAHEPAIGVRSEDDGIPPEARAAWRLEAARAARQKAAFRVEILRQGGPGNETLEIFQSGNKRRVRRKSDTSSRLVVDLFSPKGGFTLGQTSEGRWIVLGTLYAEVRTLPVLKYGNSGYTVRMTPIEEYLNGCDHVAAEPSSDGVLRVRYSWTQQGPPGGVVTSTLEGTMDFDANNGWRLLQHCLTITSDLGEQGIREVGTDRNVEKAEERFVYLPGDRWQLIGNHSDTLSKTEHEVVTNVTPMPPPPDEEFELAFYGIQTATEGAPAFWQRGTFWLFVVGAGLICFAVILRRRFGRA